MPTQDRPLSYRGYVIYRNDTAARHWVWTYHHEGYDGPGDPRRGDTRTLEDAIDEIDNLENEGASADLEHTPISALARRALDVLQEVPIPPSDIQRNMRRTTVVRDLGSALRNRDVRNGAIAERVTRRAFHGRTSRDGSPAELRRLHFVEIRGLILSALEET